MLFGGTTGNSQAPQPKLSSRPPHKPGPSGGKPDGPPDRAVAKGHDLLDRRHSFPQTTKRLPHLVECFFQKIKWFRRVATRFDKLDKSVLAFVYMAAIMIWLL